MRRLILMRHAEAEASSATGDRGRALTGQGRRDAAEVGRVLAARGCSPDLAVVSTAVRARQTWDEASHAFGDVELVEADAVYNARAADLRAEVAASADRAGVLMLVGHNPGLHQFAVDLLQEGADNPAGAGALQLGLDTATAVVFAIGADGRAHFEALIEPGEPA